MTQIYAPTRDKADESARIRMLGYVLAALALPVFALVAIAYGKEAGWDFQNYHWYDPYALLNGRLGFDIAVAHHATYYNPYLDVPLYWLATHFPAWTGGAWLGLEAGVVAALLGGIAYRLLQFEDKRSRLAVAVLLALAGLTGGGALGAIGKTSNDVAAGLGAIAGVFVLVARFDRVMRAKPTDLVWAIGLAGFLAGASPGLKLTAVPYAVGMTLAVLALPGSLRQRILRASAFGVGVLVGIAVFGGPWYWAMWRYSGNPVFPYFNEIFRSPLAPIGSFRDENFVPNSWFARLFFPFLFSQNSLVVAEWQFCDVHLLIAYIVVPIAAVASFFKHPPGRRLVDSRMARLLMVTAAGTYLPWMMMFGIYRYIIPLEILSPLVIVAAVARLPLKAGSRLIVMIVLLGGAQIVAWKGDEPRFSWKGPYVALSTPVLPDPAHTIILMTGGAPTAYVIPSFPPEIPFLRISGWMIGPNDTTSLLGAEMHRRAAEHQGPLYGLFWPREVLSALEAFADYGLRIDGPRCEKLESNIQEPLDLHQPLLFCPLKRISS